MKEDEDVLRLIRKAKLQEIQRDGDAARETYREVGRIITIKYRPYFERVASGTLHSRYKHLAEDIAQEACWGAYQSLPGLDYAELSFLYWR
jgi:DNA-directed RNA polymerase specialized sigma24 family protein